MYDVVITGGSLIDGSGAPGVRAEVAITGDRIAAAGDLRGAAAARRIDAVSLTRSVSTLASRDARATDLGLTPAPPP